MTQLDENHQNTHSSYSSFPYDPSDTLSKLSKLSIDNNQKLVSSNQPSPFMHQPLLRETHNNFFSLPIQPFSKMDTPNDMYFSPKFDHDLPSLLNTHDANRIMSHNPSPVTTPKLESPSMSEEEQRPPQSSPTPPENLTLRALVSTKEAGIIIGKQGKNVAELREKTAVKAGVTKVIHGVHDRVLTVSGTVDAVAEAYALIAKTLLDNPISGPKPGSPPSSEPPTTLLRLLISHHLMGTIIGRQGLKIKHIQDISSSRMTASKEMLPQSTERVVEIQGTVEAVRLAVIEVGKCMVEDWERGIGTVLYNPVVRLGFHGKTHNGRTSFNFEENSRKPSNERRPQDNTPFKASTLNSSFQQQRCDRRFTATQSSDAFRQPTNTSGPVKTEQISIPSDMVGCIIGKGGSKIAEIRRLSGSRISIAKNSHNESGERMFTIMGTVESNDQALSLLYNQLEAERERRKNGINSRSRDSDDDLAATPTSRVSK